MKKAVQLSNILEENDDPAHHQDSPLKQPLIEKSDSSKEELGNQQFKPMIKVFDPGEDDEQSQRSQKSQPREEKQKQIIVMTGQSGFDLDEIFGFGKNNLNPDKRKRFTLAKRITKIFGGATQDDEDEEEDIYSKLPNYFVKYLVIQSIFIGSFMVPWIQCVPSNKLLRLVWRFLFQILMLIPFVLYERRTGNEKIKACYNLKYIFKKENFRKLYISSLNTSINMLVGAQMFEWTYIGNVVLFANMANFWLSMNRQLNGETSLFVEKCGRFMCIIGIIIVSVDIYQLNADNLPKEIFDFRNPNFKYIYKEPWQRVFIGNLFTIVSCAMIAKLSKYTMDIKNIYPPFLSMFIISNILFFKIAVYSYFFDGCSFSTDQRWGFFGIIQEGRFTEFMCMSILLNFGIFMSQLFISKLFEPIVPATSALLEPIFNTFFLHTLQVQPFPGSFAGMGYLLIQPGQFVIILGQHILSKENELKAKQQIRNSSKPDNQLKPPQTPTQNQSNPNLLAPPKLSGILKTAPIFPSENVDKPKQKKPQMKVSFVHHDEQVSPSKEKQQ